MVGTLNFVRLQAMSVELRVRLSKSGLYVHVCERNEEFSIDIKPSFFNSISHVASKTLLLPSCQQFILGNESRAGFKSFSLVICGIPCSQNCMTKTTDFRIIFARVYVLQQYTVSRQPIFLQIRIMSRMGIARDIK